MTTPSKRIYLSCDIEGTCGIAHWDETNKDKADYGPFAAQMTREVVAACEGAMAGGATALLVKDAHDSARNLTPHALPPCAQLFRGWSRDPYMMVSGLDGSFAGAMFTGYHCAADTDGNPLAHTMSTVYHSVRINGVLASEMTINAYSAGYLGVPLLLVTGDKTLCDSVAAISPGTLTVPVNEGSGNGVISLHPDVAIDRIREAAAQAMALDPESCRVKLPDRFEIEVTYREHALARRNGYFPGTRQIAPRTVLFDTVDYFEALRFMLFCL